MPTTDTAQNAAHDAWDAILLNCPTDPLALRLQQDTYYYQGNAVQQRDGVARVFGHWRRSDNPLQPYLYGMHAFGLEEAGEFWRADKMAREGTLI